MTTLINDTTQVAAVSKNATKFTVRRGEYFSLRSTNLDGSASVSLYYDGPDGTFNQAVYSNGDNVVLTPSVPEVKITRPGDYRVAVTTASTSSGKVFYDK